MLERWKRAVIHLECATDSVSLDKRIQRWDTIHRKFEEGDISPEEVAREYQRGSRDKRYHGTAIFLEHERRRYLLTARHVLFDELSAKRESKSAQESAGNQIFNIIFRVPSLDEILQWGSEYHREFLMNLRAGVPSAVPYTFSTPELDLAIISLDQREQIDSRFGDDLVALGYQAIELNDISDEPSAEGSEVFTIGYPDATALLGKLNLHPATAHWSSAYVSIATLTYGRVSMLHKLLNYFWCDMSIYPGNSGGPVIENQKIVGIVSQQPSLPIETLDDGRYRIPFGKVIKAKFAKSLLEEQIKKDGVAQQLGGRGI